MSAFPQDATANPDGWTVVGRPGYVGGSRQAREKQFNRLFGEDNWRIRYLWRGRVIDRDAALELYEQAYYQSFLDRPDVLSWLCRTASEVHDIAPTNVASGLDYAKQECRATHLQDIAVRRCLKRLGRRFEGDHLVEIRGHSSEGYVLNPGKVPFHEPGAVLKPSLGRDSWWDEGSVEDFWQSNKVLEVNHLAPERGLRAFLLRELKPNDTATPAVALFGGSFNPIHLGHLRVAQDLLDLYGFAKVLFVPNGNHYRKKGLIDERHRARMVALAIEGEPRFELCDYELGRDSVVYTGATLRHVRKQLAGAYDMFQLYNLRGSDTVQRMLGWKSLPEILEATQLVPVRPGTDPWQEFGQHPTFRLHCDRFRLLPREYEDGLSSTLVRNRLALGGTARYLVPEWVAEYIQEHRLYAE
jgi:nicotinate-nucleotide adenylyltransferase